MKMLHASAAAALVLAVAVPAFAGGSHCGGGDASATTTDAHMSSCSSKSTTAAWAGAWLQRTPSGQVTIAEVAKNSPAAKSGLKSGDVLLAVNGYDLSDSHERAMCASKAECSVGKSVTYTVQRGKSTKDITLKLAKMPSDATERYAGRQATFEPAFAAVVLPAVN